MNKFFLKFKKLVALLLVVSAITSVVTLPVDWKNTDQNVVTTCGDESSWLIETR